MSRIRSSMLVLLLGLFGACTMAQAAGKLRVEDAWIRVAPPGAQMLAGYAVLKNTGDAPLSILTVQSDGFRMTSIHETVVDGDVSKMRELPRLTIAPGATVTLAPGGKHLMLMHPRAPIEAGAKVDVVFLLADGTRVPTQFDVHPVEGAAAEPEHHHHH